MAEKRDLYMEQILRCSTLQSFPQYPEGIKELRNHLRGLAPNYEFARSIMDRVMQERQFSPTPHDLTAVAMALKRAADEVPNGCEICEGQPWVTIEKLVWEFPKAAEGNRGIQYMASGSQRCICTKGQWFRSKDRENDAKRAQGLAV